MWRILGRSLILRLVGVSLLLLLIVQLAGFAVVRAGIERNARSQIARQLDVDENVWLRLLEQNAERLRQGSALLAADYGFRSAVHSGDEETIQSVLENHGSRIGATVTAFLDPQFKVTASSLADERMGLLEVTGRQRRRIKNGFLPIKRLLKMGAGRIQEGPKLFFLIGRHRPQLAHPSPHNPLLAEKIQAQGI